MATFRKRRSRKYRNKNTRRNTRRNTRKKYHKARKSRINRRTRKSLEGGLSISSIIPSFLTRKKDVRIAPSSSPIAPSPIASSPIASSPLASAEQLKTMTSSPSPYNEDEQSARELAAANRMKDLIARRVERQADKKSIMERQNIDEKAAYDAALANLTEEERNQYYASLPRKLV